MERLLCYQCREVILTDDPAREVDLRDGVIVTIHLWCRQDLIERMERDLTSRYEDKEG